VLTLLHSLYFVIKRYWQELTLLLAGVIGSSMIFYITSHIIGRPRPPTQIWIIVNIPGFPSGHATTTLAFYGLLAYLLVPKMPSAFWKGFVVVITLLIIGFVGFSRIFTAGHYLTDILAGYALGVAWCGLAFTLIELYFHRRGSRNVQKDKI
jgi:undecaprenyl-diphosphatase